MADLSKLRFNGTDYNVKDASAPLRKFTNYSKTGNLPITSDDTTQTAIGKLEKALDDKINTSAKGTASGVAELDANGKVPSSQLPSYVDDVLEYSAKSSFPATGETGKIYVDTSTNKTYRWSGSAYVEISESLALGETSSTAYRGDRGKTAYDHSHTSGNPHGTTGAGVNLTGYSKGSSTSAVAATDTINAAIAKHENRIDANQTNILSVKQKVGVNLLNTNEFSGGTSDTGINFTTENGIISAKGTKMVADSYRDIPRYDFKASSQYYVVATTTGSPRISLRVFGYKNGNYTQLIDTSGTAIFNTGDYESFLTRVVVGGSINDTVNASISAMIISKEDYEAGLTAYQPYALPNSDLTRLEAEDRAGLVECVDGGAKNLYDLSDANVAYNRGMSTRTITSSTGTIALTSDGTLSWSRVGMKVTLPAGSYVYSGKITTAAANGRITSSTDINDSAQGTEVFNPITANTTKSFDVAFTLNSQTTFYIFYYTNFVESTTTASITVANNMLATKAAFGISPAFQPWRGATNPTNYIKPTKDSKITSIDSGGYVRIGNLVNVNIRCTVGTAVAQYGSLFTGLPKPVYDSGLSFGAGVIVCTTNRTILMITTEGALQNFESTAIPTGILEISATYICK